MYKLLLLLPLLWFSIISNAQVFEKTYHDTPMVFGEVVAPIGNGEILVGTQSGQFLGWGSFSPTLFKLNNSGEKIWTNNLNSAGDFGDMKMVRDIKVINENEYLILLTFEGCDYGGWNKLLKIDGSGNQIWSVIEIGSSFDKPQLTLLENGNIVVTSGLAIYLISAEGLLLQSETMPQKANDVVEFSDTSIVVAGELGYAHVELNQDPFVYSYFIDNINYHQIKKIASGELLILQDKGVWKLDQNLDKQDSLQFDSQRQFLTFDLDENNFYLFGKSQEDSLLVRAMNFDFEWQDDFILGGENMIPRDLKVDNENLIMTAVNQDGYISNYTLNDYDYSINTGPFGVGNSSLWVKSFPKSTLPPKEHFDIGVINVQTGLVEVIDSLDCGFAEAEASFNFYDVKITVKNFGTETVSNFKLNGLFELCPFICSSWISYHEDFVNVLLEPGQEMELDLGTLYYPGLSYSGVDYDLCFWASNPDNKIDINFSNNRFCLNIPTISTDLENIVAENTFEVFPNPTNDILNIKWPKDFNLENSSILIFDAFGKVAQPIFPKNNDQEKIDLSGFDAGIYFVKIITEEGKSYTKKVVKI
ncbi:MAG: T9SS type A sorting domain-containing protein [Saprospiraceae bacterium]